MNIAFNCSALTHEPIMIVDGRGYFLNDDIVIEYIGAGESVRAERGKLLGMEVVPFGYEYMYRIFMLDGEMVKGVNVPSLNMIKSIEKNPT